MCMSAEDERRIDGRDCLDEVAVVLNLGVKGMHNETTC